MLRLLRSCRSIGTLGVVLCATSRLSAQASQENEGARIEAVRFVGVESFPTSKIQASLVTQPTRCRSLIYFPFCKLTESGIFIEKHYLERQELQRDLLRIRVFYWLRGWRGARVTSTVAPEGDGVQVTFTIAEGAPTIISALDVRQSTPVLREREITRARFPRVGEPLNMLETDSAQLYLQNRLWARGYGDATVRDTAIIEGNLARLEILVDPARRTTVGDIEVVGNERVSDGTIIRTLDLQPGQLFRRDQVLAIQRQLFQSELFRQAIVQVPETTDTAKQVLVTVREAPQRVIELGVGFNTTEFGQTDAHFTRLNWLGRARRLDLRATVGNLLAPQLHDRSIFGSAVPQGIGEVDDTFLEPTWQLSADMVEPFLLTTRNTLGFGVFARRRSVLGIVIDRGTGANVSITRELYERIQASGTYRFESTTVEAGDIYYCINFGVCQPSTIAALRESQSLSPLGLTAFADRMNHPVSPTSGFYARLELEHASGITHSDFRYNRISGETTRYLRLGPGVLAGRVRVGWVRPVESTGEAVGVGDTGAPLLHPRKRFYAGGSRSVRGFAENQLGPRVLTIDAGELIADTAKGGAGCTLASIAAATCDASPVASSEFEPRPLGGNRVIEGNLEYRIPIRGQLSAAVFIDGARLGDHNLNIPSGARSAVTPGFGVRYLSPIGPVRVDLGIRPTASEELPVVTAIPDSTGVTRLIQMKTTKEYDPLEDSSGFLGGVLGRLQLHLSIGEAF